MIAREAGGKFLGVVRGVKEIDEVAAGEQQCGCNDCFRARSQLDWLLSAAVSAGQVKGARFYDAAARRHGSAGSGGRDGATGGRQMLREE